MAARVIRWLSVTKSSYSTINLNCAYSTPMVKKRNRQSGYGVRQKRHRSNLQRLRNIAAKQRSSSGETPSSESSIETPPPEIELRARNPVLVSPMTTTATNSTEGTMVVSEEVKTWERDSHIRITIAQIFKHHLHFPPKENDLDTIKAIKKYSQSIAQQ